MTMHDSANDPLVLVYATQMSLPSFVATLRSRYAVLGPQSSGDPVARADAARVRALVTTGTVGASRAQIEALPNLGLICCTGSGFEGVDLDTVRERGIVVANGGLSNASSVADLTMGLVLATTRRIAELDRYVRAGRWASEPRDRVPYLAGLTGKNVGIVGLGAIGERIARRAVAFETVVGYHNRSRRTDVDYAYFATLAALAAWADVLVVAARADENTRGLIDASVLAELGRDGTLVNIARGSIVDEPALLAALQNGTIAGAGLDVFSGEPVVSEALRALPNVVMTPHIGGRTHDAIAATAQLMLANLDAFFAGGELPTVVVQGGNRAGIQPAGHSTESAAS
jgi:lactate dehydrogenase-like 2-hydroxyacid dehydrogenase